MSTEYYNCGLSGILQMTCKGPYESEEAAKKELPKLAWSVEPATLSVFKHQPQFTKNLVLHFKHAYATFGVFTYKP